MSQKGSFLILDVFRHVDVRIRELEGFVSIGIKRIFIPRTEIYNGISLALTGQHFSNQIIKILISKGDRNWVGLLCLDGPSE